MSSSPAGSLRARIAWQVLTVLLGLEAVLLGWVTIVAVIATIGSDGLLMQNLSLVIMAACGLLWVVLTFFAAARSRASWARGSSLTIHVLLFAAGTATLQLALGPWQLGFALVAAALAGFTAAILAKPAPRLTPE